MSCILFLLFRIIPDPSQLVIKDKSIKTPFEWVGIKKSNGMDSNGAMVVPVYLKGCQKKFFMQFDLGTPSTVLYKCVLDKINIRYPLIPFKQKFGKAILQQLSLKLNESTIIVKEIYPMDCSTTEIDFQDKKKKIIIGTIGSDFIENKVLVIDYPNKTINLNDNIPSKLFSRTELSDLQFSFRKVLLPAVINGEKKNIFFDTGTSAFELMTDKESWIKMKKKGSFSQDFPLNSWGRTWYAHSVKTDDSIKFNSLILPIGSVTYVDGPSLFLKLGFRLSGVGGLTGNKLFLSKKILLDTKRLKFGISN